MKRRLAQLFIAMYVGALSVGIVCHAVGFGTASHPAMYYVVWDMFCGWSSFANRIHVVGEGASGKYYELAPGPWGDITPFGKLGRRHYDYLGNHAPSFALNVLAHTDHEPITRIFVIEEAWSKKYNLPDHLWARQFDDPKEKKSYFQVRHVVTPQGVILQSYRTWMSELFAKSMADNPRLQADVKRNQPFYVFESQPAARGTYTPGSFYEPAANQHVGSPLGL